MIEFITQAAVLVLGCAVLILICGFFKRIDTESKFSIVLI